MRSSHAVNELNYKSVFIRLAIRESTFCSVLVAWISANAATRRSVVFSVPALRADVGDAIGSGRPLGDDVQGDRGRRVLIPNRRDSDGCRRQGRMPPLIEIDCRHSIFVSALSTSNRVELRTAFRVVIAGVPPGRPKCGGVDYQPVMESRCFA
jgi:hypothetical protein